MEFEDKYDKQTAQVELLQKELNSDPQNQIIKCKLKREENELYKLIVESARELETFFHSVPDIEEESQWE